MEPRSQKKLARCSSSPTSDWASLPEDLLASILHRLILLSDHICFAATCKPWHAAAYHHKDHLVHKQELPMLLIPPPAATAEEASYNRRRLYSVTRKKVLNLELRIPYRRRFCGSSHGWLAAENQADASITLLNPFSGKSFRFPKISHDDNNDLNPAMRRKTFYEFHVLKVVLSRDPSLYNDEFDVVAIFGLSKSLAYIRPGDSKWTYLPSMIMNSLTDAIYHLGQFYFVDAYSGIFSVDVSTDFRELRVALVAPRTPTEVSKVYIVKSGKGDLLLVQRFLEWKGKPKRLGTSSFKIFKVLGLGSSAAGTGSNGRHIVERVEIHSLGGDTLFLGDNYSLSVSASDYPGCQLNCIYSTDDCIRGNKPYYPQGSRDTGIYYLLDRRFVSHYQVKTKQKHRCIPPPVWIVPTLLP